MEIKKIINACSALIIITFASSNVYAMKKDTPAQTSSSKSAAAHAPKLSAYEQLVNHVDVAKLPPMPSVAVQAQHVASTKDAAAAVAPVSAYDRLVQQLGLTNQPQPQAPTAFDRLVQQVVFSQIGGAAGLTVGQRTAPTGQKKDEPALLLQPIGTATVVAPAAKSSFDMFNVDQECRDVVPCLPQEALLNHMVDQLYHAMMREFSFNNNVATAYCNTQREEFAKLIAVHNGRISNQDILRIVNKKVLLYMKAIHDSVIPHPLATSGPSSSGHVTAGAVSSTDANAQTSKV